MLCENCNERPATFHMVEIGELDGEKHEVHLCDECARAKKIALPPSLSLNEILSSLMEAHAEKDLPFLNDVTCPNCGTTYAEFRRLGRLGCARDYTVFKQALIPFLERIHGATTHKGKAPRKAPRDTGQAAELLKLRRELNAAIADEKYEEAARLRDRIRKLREDK